MNPFYCLVLALLCTSVLPLIGYSAKLSYSHVDSKGEPLDLKLAKILNFYEGTFIEVGANDGIRQSNTKHFEDYRGWTGILIEPSSILFDQLKQNRPHSKCYQCALGSFEENGTFAYGDFDGHLMSSLNGDRLERHPNQKVLIRSLQSILDEQNLSHIHLFSLDTEGHELNILKGIDFSKTTLDYLLIEIYTQQYQEIYSFLADQGYELVSNFSNYNTKDNPGWDGTHNDYLFKKST